MSKPELTPATEPTFYFIGVTTGQSSIMKTFPAWAEHLRLGTCRIKGIDCKQHDDPEVYREVVNFIRNDPLSLGALVTTHKLDLLKASRDMFDQLDPFAELLGEVSCISKRAGSLVGHAKDPITSGLALEAIVPRGYWGETGADLCLLGAGGSSLALTAYLMQAVRPEDRPSRIVVTNRSLPRLEEMQAIHRKINPGMEMVYVHAPAPEDNDQMVAGLPRGSMVVNATGLGKDRPGSPLTDQVVFPRDGILWDFNYRGDLLFLDQGRAQQAERCLRIEDGWVYFIHGWTRVIAEVFDRDIPVAGPGMETLCRIAEEAVKSWNNPLPGVRSGVLCSSCFSQSGS